MTILPDIMQGHRDVPAGKVLLSDNPPSGDPRVNLHILATRTAWGGTKVDLFARTPGWACAGSTMRWDNGTCGYRYEVGGAIHGRSFKTLDEARERFDALPA